MFSVLHKAYTNQCKLASELDVKNLVLYHTEKKTLATRKTKDAQEAAENFKGKIVVPDDLEVIELG